MCNKPGIFPNDQSFQDVSISRRPPSGPELFSISCWPKQPKINLQTEVICLKRKLKK